MYTARSTSETYTDEATTNGTEIAPTLSIREGFTPNVPVPRYGLGRDLPAEISGYRYPEKGLQQRDRLFRWLTESVANEWTETERNHDNQRRRL